MDSKTLSTVLVVIVCILLFPIIIGIIGGVFGLIGGIVGAVFGAITGLFGGLFGIIAGFFGAVFGLFAWLFDGDFYWDGPFHIFGSDVFTVLILVVVIALVARSRSTPRVGK